MLSLLLATAGLRVGVVRMGLFDGAKEAFSTNADKPLVAADRVTPFDRWLGLDKELVEAEAPEQVSFIDPTDAANYVSLQLAKPMGIAFIENEGDTGGICIDEILAEGSAASSDVPLQTGDQLVAVNSVRSRTRHCTVTVRMLTAHISSRSWCLVRTSTLLWIPSRLPRVTLSS
ncbi:MAG: hypothetical protein SGPRY_008477 [Prymnesium sp.]